MTRLRRAMLPALGLSLLASLLLNLYLLVALPPVDLFRLGAFNLGLTDAQVRERLGPPTRTQRDGRQWIYSWGPADLWLYIDFDAAGLAHRAKFDD